MKNTKMVPQICVQDCQGQRKEAHYMYETCPSKPTLCVVPCFKTFHREICI